MAKRYILDKDNFSFRKVGQSAKTIVGKALKWLSGAIVLAVVYYMVFCLLFNTDTELQLSKENRTYSRQYEVLQERQRLLADVVRNLQLRDDDIYRQIFHSAAPVVDPAGIIVSDSDYDTADYSDLVLSNGRRLESATARAARVEDALQAVVGHFSGKEAMDSLPPMSLPVKSLSYILTGASVGSKYNPYYRVESRHDGLDIIAPPGDPVFAAADGVVASVSRSAKGLGNVVTISHNSGYVTRYAHLGQVSVSKGQKVKRGKTIGEVGMSGKSFAPHLHYEVLHHGEPVDPVNYFFASLGPEQYAGVAYVAEHTEQSLD